MRRIAGKIVGNCMEVAIELILFHNMALFESNKNIYISHVESSPKKETLQFADNAVKLGKEILNYRCKLNPVYTIYLLECTQFIKEHSRQLQDKINKTQVYYKFEK